MSRPLLMLAAHAPSPFGPAEASYCLGVRFGGPDDIVRLEKLLINQIRRRHPHEYGHMKPKQIRQAIQLDVYEVPSPPTRAGYPKWAGESGWWH